MSTQSVYRLLCDAPYCPATAMVEELSETPAGWTRLSSTEHLAGKPKPMVGRGRNRRPVDGWEIGNGLFSLHLCPSHGSAFGEHRPQTVGYPKGRAAPGCACGWQSGSMECAHFVGRRPSLSTEWAWWRHLPEELRWYATREPAEPTFCRCRPLGTHPNGEEPADFDTTDCPVHVMPEPPADFEDDGEPF